MPTHLATATVLHTLLPDYRFEVEIRDAHTIIKAAPAELLRIKQALQHKLSSSEAFLAGAGPIVTGLADISPAAGALAYEEEKPPHDMASAHASITHLLSDEMVAGFSFAKLFHGGTMQEGVLFSKPTKSKKTHKAWAQVTEEVLSYFRDKDIASLRSAWRGQSAPI